MGITAAPGQGEAAVWGDNQASLSIGREGDGGFGDNANGDGHGRFPPIIRAGERIDLAATAKASHEAVAFTLLASSQPSATSLSTLAARPTRRLAVPGGVVQKVVRKDGSFPSPPVDGRGQQLL